MQAIEFCKTVIHKHGGSFFLGLLCAVVGFVVINIAVGRTSSPEFCGATCHEMNTAYQTWELSHHGANKLGFSVTCVECHLPPKENFFAHVAAKSYEGAKDGIKHAFGVEYDIEAVRKKVVENIPNARCLHCHDALLAKPANRAARTAHIVVLSSPKDKKSRCVVCHEDVGHERHSKLFSP